MASNGENSITIDDTPLNRYKEFIKYAITYFNLVTSIELSCAKSKDNVKANKYLNDAVEACISSTMGTVGTACGAVAGPAMAVVGKCTSNFVKDFVDDRFKSKKHDTAKKIEKSFIGYDPESKEWIELLVSVFSNIFGNFNLQVSSYM